MQIVTNPALDADLRDRLIELWVRVANAGGAVGFVAPTNADEVAPIAHEAFDRVAAGHDDLAVALDDGRPVGLGFLQRNHTRLQGHIGVVRRLQRDPARAGAGVGSAILAALEAIARDHGLRLITLSVRGGTGRESYYLARGYRVDARLPGHVHAGQGRYVDELRLSKDLASAGRDAAVDPHDVATAQPDPSLATPAAQPGARLSPPAAQSGARLSPPAAQSGARLSPPAAQSGIGPVLPVVQLDADLPLPRYAQPGDAGLDLYARDKIALDPGERALVATGVAVAVPPGHVGLIHPRSGLALRHGVTVVNAPGTIDAGYRGEVKVILANTDPHTTVVLDRGDRIAQLVIQPVTTVRVVGADTLPDTERGAGGFGSTGT